MVDISKITDANALKVIAYDALVAKEKAELDFNQANARIAELQNAPKEAAKTEEPSESESATTDETVAAN